VRLGSSVHTRTGLECSCGGGVRCCACLLHTWRGDLSEEEVWLLRLRFAWLLNRRESEVQFGTSSVS
jgi:hypothetical protein